MSISTVYKLINDIDDKVYVGSTCSKISKRITEHRRNAKEGRTSKLYQYMRTILHNPTRLYFYKSCTFSTFLYFYNPHCLVSQV